MVRLGRLYISAGIDRLPAPPSSSPRSHGTSSFSSIAAIAKHASLTAWNLALLILSIVVVARPGNGPSHYNAQMFYIGDKERLGMVFMWCFIPLLTSIASTVDLCRHRTGSARRAVFSPAFGMSLYAIAFLLWGQCAYLGYSNVCWSGGWSWYVRNKDPEILRYFLPWFALGTAIVYFVMTILAIVHLRRQRNNAPTEEIHHPNLVAGKKLSIESSEIDTSTISDQTLQSRPMSYVPSRQISQANRSTRPPTYYSEGDESLLEEKRSSGGYV